MPKTPKNEAVADENVVVANDIAAPAESKPAVPKRATKSAKAPATKKTAAKKKSASGGAKKTKGKSPGQRKAIDEPSEADIRLRAYYIAERRVQFALQGDPAKDWLEARQQLIEEARQGKF